MFALAHDDRVMRADRGFFCLPEVDIGLSFTPGMNALIAARLSPRTAHEAMTTGRRYGGIDAARAGLVEEAVEEAEVLPRALARAAAQGRQGSRHAEGGQAASLPGRSRGAARAAGAVEHGGRQPLAATIRTGVHGEECGRQRSSDAASNRVGAAPSLRSRNRAKRTSTN
jgi:enoyl-CoA hydratase/carnithine racemase